ncbi:MAG: CDP-diacylglycerol--glycerol-3-phosphate 3-phosphatidyltransferase [Isosphaeraceae bacterium]|nr:CDP-diacylglycerol--glycerol-3-phosphate 3-phosphatidyltransferase [Isosphaeraceae bacterium]
MTESAVPSEPFWNVPNALTLSRLVLAAVVLALIARGWFLGAFILFLITALTDALDGWFARKLGQETALGRQLDPLIDKVVVAALYVELLTIPDTGLQPWMVQVVIARELLIQGLRSHLEGRGQAFGAKFAGKLKTFFQCASIGAILLFASLRPSNEWLLLRDLITWIAVGATIYSGIGYAAAALRLSNRSSAGATELPRTS